MPGATLPTRRLHTVGRENPEAALTNPVFIPSFLLPDVKCIVKRSSLNRRVIIVLYFLHTWTHAFFYFKKGFSLKGPPGLKVQRWRGVLYRKSCFLERRGCFARVLAPTVCFDKRAHIELDSVLNSDLFPVKKAG